MNLPHHGKRPRFRVILVVPAILACAGCMVGPDFARPKTAVSSDWLDVGDQRVKTGPSEYRSWWRAFNDPALDRLVEQAYRENLPLRSAGMRVLQARAQLGIAIGEIFPQTQQAVGSVQYNRTSDRSVTSPSPPRRPAAPPLALNTGNPNSVFRPAGSWIFGGNSDGRSNRPTPTCSRRWRTTTTRWSR